GRLYLDRGRRLPGIPRGQDTACRRRARGAGLALVTGKAKRPPSRPDGASIAAITVVNGMPLAMTLAGWADGGEILFYYLIEFVAAGGFAVLRISLAKRHSSADRVFNIAIAAFVLVLMAALQALTFVEAFGLRLSWSGSLIVSAAVLVALQAGA